MYLDRFEEKALSGEYGEAARLAVKILVSIGEVLGAERLIPVSHAHISGVSYFNIGDEGLEFLEDILSKGARSVVFTTANPYSIAMHERYSKHYSSDVVEKQKKIVDILIRIGVAPNSFTCAPYKIRRPSYGEHIAWAESSAVIYANSVIGAYTNRESGVSALMASIIGRTYYSGMHLYENRIPRELVIVRGDVRTIALASILGLYIGRNSKSVPLIDVNIPTESDIYRDVIVRSLLASIATTSDLPLAVVKGITPINTHRAVTELQERIEVDVRELRNFVEEKCSGTLFLGCPHITHDEAEHIMSMIDFEELSRMGIERILVATPINSIGRVYRGRENVEVEYISGVCPVVSDLAPLHINFLATVHGKAYHYIPRLSRSRSCIVDIV